MLEDIDNFSEGDDAYRRRNLGGYNSGRIIFSQLERNLEKLGKIQDKHRTLQDENHNEEDSEMDDEEDLDVIEDDLMDGKMTAN